MAHVRKQIRDAVVTELKKIAGFGNRVYGSRSMVARTAPYVEVITPSETISPEESTFGAAGKPVLFREVMLQIEVRDKAGSNIGDTLDGYAVSIEEKMAGTALNALAVSVWPNSMDLQTAEDNEALEKDAAVMTLEYRVGYRTAEGSPETAIL